MLSYVDTQLFKSAENIDQVKHAINADLKKVDVWYEFNQTREIIQNIKLLLLEGSREILCWPVKEPLSVFKMNWNSLASLPIVSLNLRARCVKSVAKLVKWLLFSIVCRKYCPLNWGQIHIVLSLHRILITVQNRGITVAKEVPANLKKIIERALRFVTRAKSTIYETLLKELNLMSRLNQIIVKMATGVYKAIHG